MILSPKVTRFFPYHLFGTADETSTVEPLLPSPNSPALYLFNKVLPSGKYIALAVQKGVVITSLSE